MLLSELDRKLTQLMPEINRQLSAGFVKSNKVIYKSGRQDSISVVTRLDRQIETYLKSALKKILPSAGFIGEETAVAPAAEYNWIVDPIDGTLNFSRRIPIFCVSIALWHNNEPVYGLVSLPLQRQIYTVLTGRHFGSKPKPTRKPLITYAVVGDKSLHERIYSAITGVVLNPKNYGSCVFQGSGIALGRIDAGVFINQAIWDIGAVILLVKQAGLAIKWLSSPPDLAHDNLKKYQYSLVMGETNLTEKLCHILSQSA